MLLQEKKNIIKILEDEKTKTEEGRRKNKERNRRKKYIHSINGEEEFFIIAFLASKCSSFSSFVPFT